MGSRYLPQKTTSIILAAVLAACGGGGGGGSDTAPDGSTNTPAATTFKGVAATGAPFADAQIQIIDRTGAVVGTGTTNADGSYSVTLSAGAAAPFVLQAVRDDMTLVSVAPDTSSTTLNITPITNLIAARLSTSGDPEKLAAELQANPTLLSAVNVNAKVEEVVALLKPVLDAVGATANPLTGAFVADGTGSDRALDVLTITITPASATTSNIEVSVKQTLPEGEQPTVLQQFDSNTATLPSLPAVDATKLVTSGTAPLIADLLRRLTACYALPVDERVVTPDATGATAADVKASACKTVFHNDDPASYLSNGKRVGTGHNTAFNGIFRTGATGLVFDGGTYEFTRAGVEGDMVVSYRSTDKNGNVQNDSIVVRPDNAAAPTKLRLIGNQYLYEGGVIAYHQLRTFINQPASDYYSTGYDLRVPNEGLFSKVVVTTPKGGKPVLLPTSGLSFMSLAKNGTASGTSFLRIRGEYADTANTGDPALADTAIFFSSQRATNEEIAGYSAQSTWKFEYYLKDNVSGLPDATQYYKTRARALTIPELKTQGMSNLTQDVITDLKAGSTNGVYVVDFTGPAEIDWAVPTGALAPNSIKIFGRGPVPAGSPAGTKGANFDDSAAVGSTARTGKVFCTKQSPTDTHCTTADNVVSFAPGSVFTGLHLFAREASGREYAHFYATYSLAP